MAAIKVTANGGIGIEPNPETLSSIQPMAVGRKWNEKQKAKNHRIHNANGPTLTPSAIDAENLENGEGTPHSKWWAKMVCQCKSRNLSSAEISGGLRWCDWCDYRRGFGSRLDSTFLIFTVVPSNYPPFCKTSIKWMNRFFVTHTHARLRIHWRIHWRILARIRTQTYVNHEDFIIVESKRTKTSRVHFH